MLMISNANAIMSGIRAQHYSYVLTVRKKILKQDSRNSSPKVPKSSGKDLQASPLDKASSPGDTSAAGSS